MGHDLYYLIIITCDVIQRHIIDVSELLPLILVHFSSTKYPSFCDKSLIFSKSGDYMTCAEVQIISVSTCSDHLFEKFTWDKMFRIEFHENNFRSAEVDL